MNEWWLVFAPRPAARIRLYCLPCAGGGASMYRYWPKLLPDWIELRAVQLPGRQRRHRETPYTDCEAAAQDFAAAIGQEPPGPYAIFGHSMGGMIGYRATQLLHERSAGPSLLAVASWHPDGADAASQPDPDDDDAGFIEALRQLGGIEPEMLTDPGIMELLLPVLRADFRLCRSYRGPRAAPLPTPLAAYVGVDDIVTPPASVARWKAHSDAFLGLRTFPGGHFLLEDQAPAVVRQLVTDLSGTMAGTEQKGS